MLDAYIIDRIRREREAERNRGALVPLHIEAPEERPPDDATDEVPAEEERDRGSVIIDFGLTGHFAR